MAVPCVSVLMSVRNGGQYLEEAIRSVLAQTFQDFEFIIIDDGSTDETADILDCYRLKDPRIRVFQQPHQGLVPALNRGLAAARGQYIARMDADDVCMADRLAVQVAFMESHPTVGICGSWIETFSANGSDIRRYPVDDAVVRAWLLFESVLAHPSIMLRKRVLEQSGLMYGLTVPHAEDYDLWVRASRHTRLANIPLVLLRYRLHSQQVVQLHERAKQESAQKIRLAQLHSLGLSPDNHELRIHEALSGWQFTATKEFIADTHAWLIKLVQANQVTGVYQADAFKRVLGERWGAACASATCLGLWTWKTFMRSPFQACAGFDRKQRLKLFVKCGLWKLRHA